ncbi:unnamed protein product [Calypogeia fissa]
MGRNQKNSELDQIPMLQDDGLAVRSVEMSALEGGDAFSLHIKHDPVIKQTYGKTGASTGIEGVGLSEDLGKHEHLERSGPLGKCSNPYCHICPPNLGYSEPSCLESADLKDTLPGRSWIPGILNPHTKCVNQWNQIFCICSLIAVFTDPLFFFLLSVRSEDMCLVFNNNAAAVVTVVRSLTDIINFLHIFLQFRLAYITCASQISGAAELEDNPKKIAIHYLKGWFLLDLFTALPLPQILIWTMMKTEIRRKSGANYAKNMLRVLVLVQTIPRITRIFPLLIGLTPSGFVFETAWSNFVINLLMYLLAGHIVGACWYLFGIQRVNSCLKSNCANESIGVGNISDGTFFQCQRNFLDCGGDGDGLAALKQDPSYNAWKNNTMVGTNCLALPPDTPKFAYGIYLLGLPVVMEKSTLSKYTYALFWGLQQICTLAGNQVPSVFVGEVLFIMGTGVLGLLLFALLVGNMQNFLQALQRRKLDVQLKTRDTEAWMKQRRLPYSLQKRVKEAGRFRWVATRGVEEQELIGDLPEDLQKDIQRYLCLDLVKKVPLFELLADNVLDAICQQLYQKLFIESSEIFREGKCVERMLFIIRGKLEICKEDGSITLLRVGDFCGEELLSWYINEPPVSTTSKKAMSKQHCEKHPVSTRTVTCLTSVEAFALESEALEYITTHYKAAFESAKVQDVISLDSDTQGHHAWRFGKERGAKGGFDLDSSTGSNIWLNKENVSLGGGDREVKIKP